MFTGLVITPWLIRWLGEERYGASRVLFEYAGYLTLLDLGLGGALSPLLTRALAARDDRALRGVMAAGLRLYALVATVVLLVGFAALPWLPRLVPVRPALYGDLRWAWAFTVLGYAAPGPGAVPRPGGLRAEGLRQQRPAQPPGPGRGVPEPAPGLPRPGHQGAIAGDQPGRRPGRPDPGRDHPATPPRLPPGPPRPARPRGLRLAAEAQRADPHGQRRRPDQPAERQHRRRPDPRPGAGDDPVRDPAPGHASSRGSSTASATPRGPRWPTCTPGASTRSSTAASSS